MVEVDNKENTEITKKKFMVKKKSLFIGGIIFFVFLLLIGMFYIFLIPKISLKGKNYIKVEYGTKYEEPGHY